MSQQKRILIVDDTPRNLKLLAAILAARGYAVDTAASGAEALERVEKQQPDLVLLDVVMPEMSGYEVCRRLRESPATRLLPVVMVTALDPDEERVKGIEAGADDFLSKPIHQPELLARVRSLLQIGELHETVRAQAARLEEWNRTLEQRVSEQVVEIERLNRLKRFFSPALAEAIATGEEKLLQPHRRNVTVVFVDLRGFTAFAETAEPEEVMGVIREYHADMGRIILEHEGTLERFTGDGMMVFFNDPIEVPEPERRALRMSIVMRDRVAELCEKWGSLGYELGLGVGISTGYATLGLIGFEGRRDYAAIGTVTNLAARLCGEARHGQILVSQRFLRAVEDAVEVEPVGELVLKGLHRPVTTHNVLSLRSA